MSDSELTVANRGIWIPSAVWESKELSIQEKALLAKIHGFKECFASNGYLAEFLGLSVTRVKALIKSLDDKGYITRTEERQGQMTVKRTLHVIEAKYFGVIEHEPENGPTPAQKQAHPQPENGHHSNTELVIQNNNTVSASSDAGVQELELNEPMNTDKPWLKESGSSDADKPIRKTKAQTLLELIRSKPELLVCFNCVDDELLLEWCQVREKNNGSRSDRALSKIDRALDELRTKHGIAPEKAVEVACDKVWRSIEVEWVVNVLKPKGWPNASYQTNQNNTKVDVDAAMAPRAVRRQESTPEQLKRNQEQSANLLNMFKGG